ncbi:GNAT family N-acetyltransferase [Christiangramia sp. SM2212]|uniref:GNAT family N-acetyltransferase n=1 Tax=Christiangramia sediminicola TaxID=3073267 RepID=A0ABU1EUH1_9FLAO|nr:GNAT family N-acetyltransferase [Christiangramia sp. SM2212]MDR5592049.1 GNAT family N-acetyltransferase [Christiangramia sp. SM2212]
MSSSSIPHLKTERLILSRITKQDHSNIFKGLSHPEVIKFYGVQYSSIEETSEQMNWYENLEKAGSGMWWKIELNDSEAFCGAIGINDYHNEHQRAEIGFWLLPEHWGKRLMIEAAEKVIEYLFENINLHRLEAYVEVGNQNSAKLLKKLDFAFEGCMRDCEVKNGEYISIDIYALINS